MTYFAFVSFEDVFSLNFLLLLSGDIETNPGPHTDNCLKFFHWYLNSICARDNIKISLIEAYNSIHRFDVIALSKSMVNSSISNEDIFIEGFSKEIYRNDHLSNTKKGGVCLYFREGLPIKRRTDLELVQEMIVTEITIARKKIFFITVYRSPSQNSLCILDQIYKLYVRPHLDYGDIIYHKYDPEMRLNFTQRLGQTQYCAALAVAGAWRGTSRERLYRELGWEDLYQRRWYRRLCHFYNLLKVRSPNYLFVEIPPERNVSYNFRNMRTYDQNVGRTAR